MSLESLKECKNIWLSARIESTERWSYIGRPDEIHPHKFVFRSLHRLSSPLLIQIGDIVFHHERDLIYTHDANCYIYEVEFSGYFEKLTFVHAWARSLKENDIDNILNSRSFTGQFIMGDLCDLIEKVYFLLNENQNWNDLAEGMAKNLKADGIELYDTFYQYNIFSWKKDKLTGLPNISMDVGHSSRYRLKFWGSEDDRPELEIMTFLIERALLESHDSFRSSRDDIIENKSRSISRDHTMVGVSEHLKYLRKQVLLYRDRSRHIWIKGEAGVGKTLYARVFLEESYRDKASKYYFGLSKSNQQKVIVDINAIIENKVEDEKIVIAIDNMNFVEEHIESELWKIFKRSTNIKFIFVALHAPSIFFEGEMITIKPLRERYEDIFLITNELIKKICNGRRIAAKQISDVFYKKMKIYNWPNNFNELSFYLKRIVEHHRLDELIKYENENYIHQCDPKQRQVYRFLKADKENDFSRAYWKEKVMKSS